MKFSPSVKKCFFWFCVVVSIICFLLLAYPSSFSFREGLAQKNTPVSKSLKTTKDAPKDLEDNKDSQKKNKDEDLTLNNTPPATGAGNSTPENDDTDTANAIAASGTGTEPFSVANRNQVSALDTSFWNDANGRMQHSKF
jgi:hypothetical protein